MGENIRFPTTTLHFNEITKEPRDKAILEDDGNKGGKTTRKRNTP